LRGSRPPFSSAAFITGILAGLFGIGGGALIVPVLYEVFRALGVPEEVRFQLCVGTSIAIIVPTNIRSFLIIAPRGAVMMDVVRIWAVPAVIGVRAVGSAIAGFASGAVLKIAFVLVASVIAAKLILGTPRTGISGNELPGRMGMTAWGFVVGLSSSLMGTSGGSVSNVILTLYGKSIHQASRPRPRSACRSRSPAQSATCSADCRSRPCCRHCRSDSCR